ncbi:alpha/beta hydrolase [Bradyrhizobium sp. 33ap4]|uniref:alpha/beta hydrolase n=1 Tax=Bradyrhizobium sp. 33ap4 TaxID=3061630 RepID=UPI002930696C|nr:alpha/beta hydrolase [Bradyrhizobium sp. 33ap4]
MGRRQLRTEHHIQGRVLSFAEDNGYALVSIDYRLAPEMKPPGIASDIEAAFAWLANDGAKRFNLNTDQMVVGGDSAGGYLTLLTGYRAKPKTESPHRAVRLR